MKDLRDLKDFGDTRCKTCERRINYRTEAFTWRHGRRSWVRRVAGMVMSNTDANTLLHMYQMHVLDTDQVRSHLTEGINSIALESQHPHKVVNLLFAITK